MNGDIVAIEILPKHKWIKNYKTTDLADVLDDNVENEGLIEVDNAEAQQTLMHQINESKQQVTGKVVGVIKNMIKTYGGSILSL